MLVDLTPNKDFQKQHKEFCAKHCPDWSAEDVEFNNVCSDVCHLDTGIYFDQMQLITVAFDEIRNLNYGCRDWYAYGTCDNIEQIKRHYPEIVSSTDKKFFIKIEKICQDVENAGKGGGFRWHKNGSYIGDLNPQYEYLDDEEFGDWQGYVLLFTIFQMRDPNMPFDIDEVAYYKDKRCVVKELTRVGKSKRYKYTLEVCETGDVINNVKASELTA